VKRSGKEGNAAAGMWPDILTQSSQFRQKHEKRIHLIKNNKKKKAKSSRQTHDIVFCDFVVVLWWWTQ
jgi:hypothetical protein